MRRLNSAVSEPVFQASTGAAAAPGFGWRQLATVLLLALTLPVFLVAGAAALAVLPVVLTVVGIGQLREAARVQWPPTPLHGHH